MSNRVRGTVSVPIAKLDPEKRLVTGVVLEPDVVDAHGHYESVETIERAAHKFMFKYRERLAKLGIQHTVFGEVGFYIVESYLAPVDFNVGGELITKGSWVITVKVTSDELWLAVKEGAITGFSIGAIVTIAVDQS